VIRVCHLITGLEVGGAETSLVRLLSGIDRGRFEHSVVSLTTAGSLGREIQRLGIPLFTAGLARGRLPFGTIPRVVAALRSASPHVLQTWMYHADLAGYAATRFLRIPALVWNVRASDVDMTRYGMLSTLVGHACAVFSEWPDAIVVNSESGRQHHARLGYRPPRWVVIPNGIDAAEFRPSATARADVRRELGLSEATLLVGLVARFDPIKNHRMFVQAAGAVARLHREAHFVMVGNEVTPRNLLLAQWIEEAGIRDRVALLGSRDDVARIDAALDVATLASHSEGFPNVVAEAMACGVPVVVTDVGAASAIVGDTGIVVPPRDLIQFTNAIDRLLAEGAEARQIRGEAARLRIQSEYNLTSAVGQYEALYEGLAAR
jgi:glycosyltransferase involved in cell wall biosynthesis